MPSRGVAGGLRVAALIAVLGLVLAACGNAPSAADRPFLIAPATPTPDAFAAADASQSESALEAEQTDDDGEDPVPDPAEAEDETVADGTAQADDAGTVPDPTPVPIPTATPETVSVPTATAVPTPVPEPTALPDPTATPVPEESPVAEATPTATETPAADDAPATPTAPALTPTTEPTSSPPGPDGFPIECQVSGRTLNIDETVTFELVVTIGGPPMTFSFNHGDGTTGFGQRSVIRYPAPGTYVVTASWATTTEDGVVPCGAVEVFGVGSGPFQPGDYVSLDEASAVALAQSRGFEARIVRRDAINFPGTTDFRTDRLNFEVDAGLVTLAYIA